MLLTLVIYELNKMKIVELVFTEHAIKRIGERCGNTQQVISLTRSLRNQNLIKNRHSYEICIPQRGRLVGSLKNGQFVVKTFLYPRLSHLSDAKKLFVQKYIVSLSTIHQTMDVA